MSKLNSELLAHGSVVREPVGAEKGYWVGAPGVFYAADEKAYYVTYRVRRPRGVAPDRGGEAKIARSTDLKQFTDVWTVTKERYDSASIERSIIRKGNDGIWRYFTSYVDPADGRWCVTVLKGTDVRQLDAGKVERVFTAKPMGLEGIKDPWIYEEKGVYYMFLSVAVPTPRTSDKSHETLDIFNTGECVSATGLAISRDLDHWEWQGVVLQPGPTGWDCYCRRINSILPLNGKYFAFYDGSASEQENYEERNGIAVSSDLHHWEVLTTAGPNLTSPFASASLRYVDAQIVGGQANVFYEFARRDGAHDLRLVQVPVGELAF